MNGYNKITSLYHNRTLAVTEAYALIAYLLFNTLKYSNLICGMSFCYDYSKYNKLQWTEKLKRRPGIINGY
ncbi:hypothetical protein HDF22_001705 [Mucilaginibacter lappiensis]|uniref:Uncharacterized protein n=1 Tax=Mucilaginibacter lappiensis TaxID=354630 RepID=A0A841J9V4_9SPHI|nr:hypothetical protein [Mucilaginibacter lappiensis]